MKQHEQRSLDALKRAKDFLDANAGVIGALARSAGKHQLDAAVARLAELSNEQGTADLQIAGHMGRQRALISALRTQHMQPIAIFARARLRGTPDYAALVRSAPHLQLKQLVRAAKAMATAAAPHVDEMVRGGFAADAVTQLAAAATAVEQAQLDRTNTRVRRVGATRGIAEEILKGREAVAMLHAVIRSQLAGNPTFLAAWESARRVTAKLRPARTPAAPSSVAAA